MMHLTQEMTAILITLRTKRITFKYLYLVCIDHIGLSNTSQTPSLFNVQILDYITCLAFRWTNITYPQRL